MRRVPFKTIFLSILFIFFYCKKKIADKTINQVNKQDSIKEIEVVNKQTQKSTKPRKHFKYVIAESGLNYRDTPKGKIIGQFNWRDKVEYLFRTNHTQKIIDNYREIEGTWVAVKQKKDTVYVFDSYLSSIEPRFSTIKLYNAEAYFSTVLKPSNKKDIRQAFVNVSESFYMPANFIAKKDLKKDIIHFSKKQRTEFLKRMSYAVNDTLFIYDFNSGHIKKHPVKDTPLMACMNIYSHVEDEYKTENYNEWSYEVGFNLGKANYGGFATVAKENPFVEKGLIPFVFEEVHKNKVNTYVREGFIPNLWQKDTAHTIYTLRYENMRSFVKRNKKDKSWTDLIVKNVNTKEAFEIYQSGGEGSSKAPIAIKNDTTATNASYQFIGKLFKNKPPVTFGFVWESFSCTTINFLDKEELPILVLCDNRH